MNNQMIKIAAVNGATQEDVLRFVEVLRAALEGNLVVIPALDKQTGKVVTIIGEHIGDTPANGEVARLAPMVVMIDDESRYEPAGSEGTDYGNLKLH